jgi:CBS domain-containing protein
MSAVPVGLLVIFGGLLLFVSLLVRVKSGGKYEIKMIDITLVLIPLFFWLFATGKIKKMTVGGVEVETAQAFVQAAEVPIESQVTLRTASSIEDVVETVELHQKEGVEKIPELIKNQVEALEFQLGHGGYWGPAIRTYFESLGAHSFLRYAVIHEPDGTLFGVYSAKDLLLYFQNKGDRPYDEFADDLNHPTQDSRQGLMELPGYIPGANAVDVGANKRGVLARMEELKSGTLPVVDSNRHFVGMVDRDQVTASLIMDVADKLEEFH